MLLEEKFHDVDRFVMRGEPYPGAPSEPSLKGLRRDVDVAPECEDITQRYLDEIGRTRVLIAEEERYLARQMQAGEDGARDKLIVHNLKLVVHMAKRYLGRGLPLLDLVEEGNLGLMHALDKFDPERGIRLSTYAGLWIRQSMELALMNQSRTVRLPVHKAKALKRCIKALQRLEQMGVTDAGGDKVAAACGIPVAEVRELFVMGEHPVPLDAPLEIDPSLTVGDSIADEERPTPEEYMQQFELERQLEEWLGSLPERHRIVIERRFGLNGRDIATLDEMASELGVSAERIRQLQISALKMLSVVLRTNGMGQEDAP